MLFRNKKSGAIVDVPSELHGNWERIDGRKVPEKEPSFVSVPEPVEDEADVKSAKKTRTTKRTKK